VKLYKYIFSITVFFLLSVSADAARRMQLVDINFDSAESISRVPQLSLEIAEEIVRRREEKGYYTSLDELKEIPGISEELFNEIEPFLTATDPKEIKADEVYEELEELQERESADQLDVDFDMLDRYRTNPLNLNTATEKQLMDLPYINEETAQRIISYRRRHRGFKKDEELKKIVSDETYKKVYPFIAVDDEKELEEFHGDLRFRYGLWPYPFSIKYVNLDPIYHNPQYFYSRLRLYYGNKGELGLVLRKDRSSHELNYENIRMYYLIKQYLLLRNVLTLDTVVIGNYSLDFAQGVFIQPAPFLIRRIPRKPRGLREDKGTHYNENFYGVAGVNPGG